MIPVYQKYLHKEGEQNGDCWRACLASILEMDIDTFPQWELTEEWSDYFTRIVAKLRELGYQWMAYTIENTYVDCIKENSIDGYVIAVGKSPRSLPDKRLNHAVVWKNGIVHDPHLENKGILDIITFEVLIKI